MVPRAGLEPAYLAVRDFKSLVSTISPPGHTVYCRVFVRESSSVDFVVFCIQSLRTIQTHSMHPLILKFAQFVARRPSDKTIRLMHIITGLLIIAILWWAQDRSVIDIPFYKEEPVDVSKKIEFILMILAFFFITRGLVTVCIFKHKWLRITQAIHGLALIIVGGPMMDPIMTTVASDTNNAFNIAAGSVTQASWHPGVFLVLLGIFWILVGLTGKGTTEKCIRFGELVKKIRV
jgi:uncharacterized membrane protein YwzB